MALKAFNALKDPRMKTRRHENMNAATLLTSHQVGQLLQVNPSSINKWIGDGRIEAFRTPGGHRRIRAGDLVTFLEQYEMPIPEVLKPAAQRRLLVLDADEANLAQTERSMQPHDGRVCVQTSRADIDALMLVGAFQPHAIVLDADADGLPWSDVCSALRDNNATRGVAVVVTAREPDAALREAARQAGVRHCTAKPPPVGILLDALGVVASS